jgi:hypothetical protein
MKIGDTIIPWKRNNGASLGLEYPYIGAKLSCGLWCIWHRHTGLVVWISTTDNDLFGYRDCTREMELLNNIRTTRAEQDLINILHDMEA